MEPEMSNFVSQAESVSSFLILQNRFIDINRFEVTGDEGNCIVSFLKAWKRNDIKTERKFDNFFNGNRNFLARIVLGKKTICLRSDLLIAEMGDRNLIRHKSLRPSQAQLSRPMPQV